MTLLEQTKQRVGETAQARLEFRALRNPLDERFSREELQNTFFCLSVKEVTPSQEPWDDSDGYALPSFLRQQSSEGKLPWE